MKALMNSIGTTILLAAAATAQTPHLSYSIRDLGPVGEAPGAPYFIAANGLIAGATVSPQNTSHASVWFMGFKQDLGTPALGGPNSLAMSINSLGQVVGSAQTTTMNTEDFCGFNTYGMTKSSTSCVPFLWQNGAMTKLATLGGPNGMANGINNTGEAVGWAEMSARDPNAACPVNEFGPVMWGKNGVTKLSTHSGDPDGVAAAINDLGQVVGASGSCGSFNTNSGLYLVEKHALLWEGGTMIDLGNLGGDGNGSGNHACAINNLGQVAGHSDLAGDATFHGFLWTWQSGMQDLGTLPGDVASLAIGIGDQGLLVGGSLDSNFDVRAMVYENGAMSDLNTLVSANPGKLYLLLAYSINAANQIVGFGATSDGTLHGFLATPDFTANHLTNFENLTKPVLPTDARTLLFRRMGIRGR
jgi:probable HAF family extracellular repeat protein